MILVSYRGLWIVLAGLILTSASLCFGPLAAMSAYDDILVYFVVDVRVVVQEYKCKTSVQFPVASAALDNCHTVLLTRMMSR